MLEELLITIFAGGHNLLEGVPGLAKTLMINTLARLLSLDFKRIQFTPDLMPSDIVGTNVIEEDHTTGKRVTVFVAGPIFTNVLLADEINRTPPKTQAALLQAMQEKEVTAGGKTYKLAAPFFVLATQNPIDQEGTYPLPEAQKDRFLLNTFIKYPQLAEEEDIVERTTANAAADVQAGLRPRDAAAVPAAGPQHPGVEARHRLRRRPGARDAARGAGRAGLHQGAGRLGRRAARQPGADPLRQVPTRPCRAGSTSPATTCATWRCRCCGTASAASFAAEAEGITHRRDHPPAAGRRCRSGRT